MNTHRRQATCALTGLVLSAALASTGCTPAFDAALPPAGLLPAVTDLVAQPADAIRVLTQGVNWSRMEVALPIEGF